MRFYGGAREKVCRLGLADLFLELQQIIFETVVNIEETKEGNGAASVREAIDASFDARVDWVKKQSGGVDRIKRIRYNSTFIARIGVEIQVSARSDILIRDVVHLRKCLQDGEIDVGVIVVPSDNFQTFLPDRTPALRDAVRYIEQEFPEATKLPIILLALEHDGIGVALPKKVTNRGAGKQKKKAKNIREEDV